MTVAELMELLRDVPGDTPVLLNNSDTSDHCHPDPFPIVEDTSIGPAIVLYMNVDSEVVYPEYMS